VCPTGLTLVDSEDLRAGDEDEDDYGDNMVDDDNGEMYSDEDEDDDDIDEDNGGYFKNEDDDEDDMSTDSDEDSHRHRRRQYHPSVTARRLDTSPRWVPANGEEEGDGGDDDEWESVDDEDGGRRFTPRLTNPFSNDG